LNAGELGIKLEIAGNLAIWKASPIYKQKAVDRIRESFEKSKTGDCECLDVADVYVYFPDGSLMRPDISVFRDGEKRNLKLPVRKELECGGSCEV